MTPYCRQGDTAPALLIFLSITSNKEKVIMSQNLVSLNFTADDMAAIAAAIATLEAKLSSLILNSSFTP